MLRGRRLLLPQSPLSGWRTTASSATTTTTAAANRAFYSTSQVNDDGSGADSSVPEAEPHIHINEEVAEKGEGQILQNLPNATGETSTKDTRAAGPLAFRKYVISDKTPATDKFHVYAKVPSRYRKLGSTEEQYSGQHQGSNLRHQLVSATSSTARAESLQLPLVKRDAASEWTEEWVVKVGQRLGLHISKRDEVYFKLSLARGLGIKVDDRRLASPALALAEIEHRERQYDKVGFAKNRQEELVVEGKKPLFLPRNRESHQRSNPQSTEARLRSSGVGAQSKAPNSPEGTEGWKVAQLTISDLVGGNLRDSLRDDEFTPAQADDVKPTPADRPQDQTNSFFQRRGFSAGRFEAESSSYEAERAPTGIRFSIRPTWLAFGHRNAQAKNVATEEEETKASSHREVNPINEDQPGDSSQRAQQATELLPTTEDGSEEPQPPQSSTDSILEPLESSSPSAGSVPLTAPRSRPASPGQVNQVTRAIPPQPKQSSQNIYGMLFPEETEADSNYSRPQGKAGRKTKSPAKRHLKPKSSDGGIYKKLFPDDFPQQTEPQLQSPSQPEEMAQVQQQEHGLSPNEQGLVPPEDSIFVSLRNEVRSWIPEEQRKTITAPEPGEFGSHSTVMILSGLSNSLVDTDFYRILPESKHIEGWAGGLVKVVQARDSLSHEPLGRYFLMFHSKPAADAYKAEILRLHALSKRLLYSFMSKVPHTTGDTNSQPLLTEAEKAAVRAFTLCPPTAPLVINVHMWNTNLVRDIAQNTNIADVVQALRPDVATPSKVLVTVNTIPGSKAGAGGGLTTDELWLTLRDDGRERGAPWVLSNLKEGIMPVKMLSSARHGKIDFRSEAVQAPLEGPIYDEQDMLAEPPTTTSNEAEPFSARRVTFDAWHDPNVKRDEMMDKRMFLAPESTVPAAKVNREERFNRFVVTFTQPAISRRFVRSWHKRAIWDEYERRTVSIDAVALM